MAAPLPLFPLHTVLHGLKDQDLPPALKQSRMPLENPLLRLERVGDLLAKGGITP